MSGPWPPPRPLVEYVCPFDASRRHFNLKLDAEVPWERVVELVKEHLDTKHSGWMQAELERLAALQRAANPGLLPAKRVRSQALDPLWRFKKGYS